MKEYIEKVLAGQHLSADEASRALEHIVSGDTSEAQVAALLVALRAKGESVDELLGFARLMQEKSLRVCADDVDAIDIVGTGGDGLGTFNVSTAASFVAAGAGVTVAKHGNRAVSSSSGSADLLTALGVNVQLSPEKVQACINDVGIGFMFAPVFHPAMKAVARLRSELGIRTIFNLLGPLTNPARVKRALIGTFSPIIAEKLAGVLSNMQMRKAFVANSEDGMDEIALSAKTYVQEVVDGVSPMMMTLSPADFAFEMQPISAVKGGTAEQNAAMTLRMFKGEAGPLRSIVVMNAAAAIVVAGKAADFMIGKRLAEESIDSGSARENLKRLIEYSNRA